MNALHFPNGATETLHQAYRGEASRSTDTDKWLVYTTDSIPASAAHELSYDAMKAYNDQILREEESEWEELGFIKPAKQTCWGDLQAVLEHHLGMVGRRVESEGGEGDDVQFYVFGFVAVTRLDWREQGGTVVHCDLDRGKWKVTQCNAVPADQLGIELTSVGFGDEEFDRVRERFDGSGSDGLDKADETMGSLRLPEDTVEILQRACDCEADTSEFDKWLIYTTGSVARADSRELFYAAMKAYNDQCLGEDESEWEELGFAKIAASQITLDLESNSLDLQRILEHHLRMVRRQFPDSDGRDKHDDVRFYIWGFIALTSPDWRERGVTVVHCDLDHGKWKVTQCSGIPIDQLGFELTSVSDNDTDFDVIRERYAGNRDENNGPDNVGGPAPVGEWQFAVYCVGISRSKAEVLIPDPRGIGAYNGLMGDNCLWFLPQVESRCGMDEVKEDWPAAYAKAIKDPTIPANGQPNVCKRHPELFVVVVEGGDERPAVKIVEMKWDQDVERSEEELRRVGRESEVIIRDCEPDAVVSTLERLARGEQVE